MRDSVHIAIFRIIITMMSTGTNIHSAFQLKPGTGPLKYKVESYDAANSIVCCGDTKGNVVLGQLSLTDKEHLVQDITTSNVWNIC